MTKIKTISNPEKIKSLVRALSPDILRENIKKNLARVYDLLSPAHFHPHFTSAKSFAAILKFSSEIFYTMDLLFLKTDDKQVLRQIFSDYAGKMCYHLKFEALTEPALDGSRDNLPPDDDRYSVFVTFAPHPDAYDNIADEIKAFDPIGSRGPDQIIQDKIIQTLWLGLFAFSRDCDAWRLRGGQWQPFSDDDEQKNISWLEKNPCKIAEDLGALE